MAIEYIHELRAKLQDPKAVLTLEEVTQSLRILLNQIDEATDVEKLEERIREERQRRGELSYG